MGRLFIEFADNDGSEAKYVCQCGVDVASERCVVWEGFMGANVPALLFKHGVNVEVCGAPREEVLSTGRYVLVDVKCRCCCMKLGWRYLEAEKSDQKYKEECYLLRQSLLERVDTTVLQPIELERNASHGDEGPQIGPDGRIIPFHHTIWGRRL